MSKDDKTPCCPSASPDDFVTLSTSDGREVRLLEIAGIALRGGFYAILKPIDAADLFPQLGEDEALVFKVMRGEGDSDRFEIVTDNVIINAVFAEYERLLADAGGGSGDGE